jgi:hypothetical protein
LLSAVVVVAVPGRQTSVLVVVVVLDRLTPDRQILLPALTASLLVVVARVVLPAAWRDRTVHHHLLPGSRPRSAAVVEDHSVMALAARAVAVLPAG